MGQAALDLAGTPLDATPLEATPVSLPARGPDGVPPAIPANIAADWQQDWEQDLADDRAGIRLSERILLERFAARHLAAPQARAAARTALARARSLGALLRMAEGRVAEATAHPGLAADLRLAGEMVEEIHRRHLDGVPLLANPEPLAFWARAVLWALPHREVHAAFLDADGYLTALERLGEGTLDRVAIYPREVAARALARGAAHVYLVSNTCAREGLPPESVLRPTEAAAEALRALGIGLVDHLLVTRDRVMRLASEGYAEID